MTGFCALSSHAASPLEPLPVELAAAFDVVERESGAPFGVTGRFDSQAAHDALRRVLAAYAMHDPETLLGGSRDRAWRTPRAWWVSGSCMAYAASTRFLVGHILTSIAP